MKKIKTEKKTKKRGMVLMLHCLLAVFLFSTSVYASNGSDAITAPMNSLLSLVENFVTGIGAIVTLFGIFEFGNAQQTQDGAAKTYALQRIAGGLVMLVAPQLLSLFR